MSLLTEHELLDALSGYLRVCVHNETLGAVADHDSGHEIGWEVEEAYEDLRRSMLGDPDDLPPLTDDQVEQLVNLGPEAVRAAQAIRYAARGKFT